MTRSVSAKSAWPAPVVLTSGTRWRFRRREATGPGPWTPSIAQALDGVAGRQQMVAWPTAWLVFSRIQAHWPIRSEPRPQQREVPTAALAGPLPESLHLDGEQLDRLDLVHSDGRIDLAAHFGEARNLRCAWLFAEYTADRTQELIIHSGADWWHQWFVARAGLLHQFTVDGLPADKTNACRGS